MSESKHTPERPPKARIDEILGLRGFDSGRMRYAERRDYLQLCSEVDWCRIERAALLKVLKAALEQVGCDGDLCMYQWHEDARKIIDDVEGRS